MEKIESKRFNFEQSPIKEIYDILGVNNPKDIYFAYFKEDQNLMDKKDWDYNNSDLLINKVKQILDSIDDKELSGDEIIYKKKVLWLWYHHAISCAVWRYKDKIKAIEYSEKALGLQDENHQNQITRLLNFLVKDELEEAEKFVDIISDEVEKDTARYLINQYKIGKFF